MRTQFVVANCVAPVIGYIVNYRIDTLKIMYTTI